MSLDALSRDDYFPNSNGDYVVQYSTKGYGSIGVSIRGTFGTGYILAEGSNDGVEWETLPVAAGNTQLTDNQIVAAGTYVISTVNYSLVRLTKSVADGSLILMATISSRITPPFSLPIA